MQHETTKKTSLFPDFSRFFPPLRIFVSHQTINLKGILSHVSLSENEVSLCKYEFAKKFLGLCSRLPLIYQGFCQERKAKEFTQNETPPLKRDGSPPRSDTRVLQVLPSQQKDRKKKHLKKQKGDEQPKYDKSLHLIKVTEGLISAQFQRAAQRCRNAKPAEMFYLRPHSTPFICSYAHFRAMLMEITNVNTGLNTPKVSVRSDSAKLLLLLRRRSVGLHLCISILLLFPSPSPFFFFF